MHESTPTHLRLRRRSVGRLCAGLALFVGVTLIAQADPQPSAEELIEQLGAAAFGQREQAEQKLRERGAAALELLRSVSNDPDLEVRYRARRLIDRIEHEQQWRLLENFLTNYDPELAQQLPGWSRYARCVGDDLPARRLFVEMFDAEPEIMSALGRQPQTLSLILEKRVLEMSPASNRHPVTTSLPAASTGVLLLASLEPGVQSSATTRTLINSLVNESEFQRAATASADPPIRRLLSGWVSQATDIAPSTRMTIGTKFEMPSAVDPALELIRSKAHGSQLQYAVFTVARLGGAEHAAALEELLDNPTMLSERQRGEDENFTCQVRDVALAALIHLVGMHPREFGFRELRPNSNSLYALNTAGFDSEDDRQAAFRKWKLWQQVQSHDAWGVAETAVAGVGL